MRQLAVMTGAGVSVLALSACMAQPAAVGATVGPSRPDLILAEGEVGMGVEPQAPRRLPGPGDLTPLEQALAQDASAALIMLLARTPDSPEAPAARAALAARHSPDPAAVTQALAGADAGVVADFDAARLAGTQAAWQAFLSRHGSHPLAVEAAFWR
jgi:hypothetical protein